VQVLLILYKSALGMDRIKELFRERAAKYEEVPGLIQKLYVADRTTGEVGGIYLFESEERLRAFVATGLEDIRQTYLFREARSFRDFDVLQILRAESSSHDPDSKGSDKGPQQLQPAGELPSVSIPGSAPQPPIEPRK
jgi:hypothetical protein